MVDISKCEGTGCPRKNICYRYRAVSGDYQQAYLSRVPYNKELKQCCWFMPLHDNDRLTEIEEENNELPVSTTNE